MTLHAGDLIWAATGAAEWRPRDFRPLQREFR